jgi:hypothetical protein
MSYLNLEIFTQPLSVTDAVCRNLKQILEQSDAPARERRYVPFPIIEIF